MIHLFVDFVLLLTLSELSQKSSYVCSAKLYAFLDWNNNDLQNLSFIV
jgi:hypothetical protein